MSDEEYEVTFVPVRQTIREDGTRVVKEVELLSWGPAYDGLGGVPVEVDRVEHTEEGVLVHGRVDGEVVLGFDGARPASPALSDNARYDVSPGQERDAGWLTRRIAEHRPVPAPSPFHLPSALGGLPEPEDGEDDPNEPVRYVANRADRRRLDKRRRRRG